MRRIEGRPNLLFRQPVLAVDRFTGSHRETWPIQSRGFRRWLKRRFFEECEGAPNGEAVAQKIGSATDDEIFEFIHKELGRV